MRPRLSIFFLLTIPPPPISTLFPYTTLFRSSESFASSRSSVSARIVSREPLMVSDSGGCRSVRVRVAWFGSAKRSEEHTSELQSRFDLVCRLLLEKKKNQ